MGKYEDKMKRLKEVVRRLEREDVDVEEALHLYHEGETLAKECEALLEEAKEKIKKINGG